VCNTRPPHYVSSLLPDLGSVAGLCKNGVWGSVRGGKIFDLINTLLVLEQICSMDVGSVDIKVSKPGPDKGKVFFFFFLHKTSWYLRHTILANVLFVSHWQCL
jgi:hypothetical protein